MPAIDEWPDDLQQLFLVAVVVFAYCVFYVGRAFNKKLCENGGFYLSEVYTIIWTAVRVPLITTLVGLVFATLMWLEQKAKNAADPMSWAATLFNTVLTAQFAIMIFVACKAVVFLVRRFRVHHLAYIKPKASVRGQEVEVVRN